MLQQEDFKASSSVKVKGLGFRFEGLGLRVQGLRLRIQVLSLVCTFHPSILVKRA